MKNVLRAVALLAGSLALVGCATNTSLYSWGPYENEVYAYFKNESPEEQILILEKHAQETKAKGQQLPPGFRAHLGLLYSKVGRDDDFVVELAQEKAAFPESAVFVDNLLAKAAKAKSKQEASSEQK